MTAEITQLIIEPYDFVEWPSPALHQRLGALATNMRTVALGGDRAANVAREASHLTFELEQRGELSK